MSAKDIEKYQFQPGQSGNRKGRPKRRSLEEYVNMELDVKLPVPGTKSAKVTKRRLLAKVLVDEILTRRNARLITVVLARIWPEERNVRVSGHLDVHEIVDDAAEQLDAILDKLAAQYEGSGASVDTKPAGSGGTSDSDKLH